MMRDEFDLDIGCVLEELQEAERVDAVVRAMGEMMAAYDPALRAHAEAAGALARRLALELQLDADTVVRAELGARLHDIGLVGVDRAILNKPGPLDTAERSAVCRHPEIGEQILNRTPVLAPLAPLVGEHHERADGTGYPRKLRGDAIHIESSIIAVVTAFHSMTVPQPYRPARSIEAALDEIEDCAGTQFAPEVATAFVRMFRTLDG
jgi:HD-GYP domain-containing protein (c-di-GMP phosphodiesterase class II)